MADFNTPAAATLADNKALVVDGIAPNNQDTVFTASITRQGSTAVTIASSGDSTNRIWFAPAGLAVGDTFTPGDTMTMAPGDATSIQTPSQEGIYHIYVIDAAGNVSAQSAHTLRVDNTNPSIAITAPNGGVDFTTGTADQTLSGTCSDLSTHNDNHQHRNRVRTATARTGTGP